MRRHSFTRGTVPIRRTVPLRRTVSTRRTLPGLLAVLLAAVSLVGCPGSLDNPEAFGGGRLDEDAGGGGNDAGNNNGGGLDCTGVDIVADVLASDQAGGCALSTCHVDGAQSPDLGSADTFGRLVDMPALACAGANLIDSADPESSAIYQKTLPSGGDCGGLQMPVGGSLTETQQACLLQWIKDGGN